VGTAGPWLIPIEKERNVHQFSVGRITRAGRWLLAALALISCGTGAPPPAALERQAAPLVAEPTWFSSPLVPGMTVSEGGFGATVALSGNTAVIGAPFTNAAYVFTHSQGWQEQLRLDPPVALSNQTFGDAVAISGDTVVVAASRMAGPAGDSQGAVFVFERTGMTFGEPILIQAEDGAAGDWFGSAVAIEGDTLVVGAMNAMSISDPDGAGGAEGEPVASGVAHVFTRSAGEWSRTGTLAPQDGYWWDSFGLSVALSGDTAVVGAPIARNDDGTPFCGAVYVFERTGENWDEDKKLMLEDPYFTDEFGHSVAIDGQLLVIGAWASRGRVTEPPGNRAGSAYVYTNDNGAWAPLGGLFANDPQELDHFGTSVAVSGQTVMVGAERTNSVYVFTPRESLAAIQVLGGRDLVEPYGGNVALDGDLGLVGTVRGTGVPHALERAVDIGDACEADDDCRSGHCADGVCCDRACDGACEACGSGTCAPTPGDTASPTCAPYLCSASEGDCLDSCESSDDCIETHYCNDGECDERLSNGKACTASRDCASGACVDDQCQGTSAIGEDCSSDTDCESEHCTDGVCCDDACTGQCEACSVKGSVGTCSPVTGNPRGQRPDCDGGDGPCAGTCDGRQRNRCTFPDSSEPCGASCAEGEQTQSFCDGEGGCLASEPRSCRGYDCADERVCRTSCQLHADCAAGFTCSTQGTCEARSVCVDESQSMAPDGELEDCGAFRCGPDGTFLSECESVDDCSGENVCDRDGRCAPLPTAEPPPAAATTSTRESGCACSTPAQGRSSGGPLGLLFAFGLFVGHRRRRKLSLPRRSPAQNSLPSP
jgi:MYXO-CTERM domain-containing protein